MPSLPRPLALLLLAGLLLALPACGGEPDAQEATDEPPAASSLDALARMVFEALRSGDVEAARAVLRGEADAEWLLGRVAEAGGEEAAEAARRDLAIDRDGLSHDEAAVRLIVEGRRSIGKRLDWEEASYGGLDEDATTTGSELLHQGPDAERLKLAVEHAAVAIRVETDDRVHRLAFSALRLPSRGWILWGGPRHEAVVGWRGEGTTVVHLRPVRAHLSEGTLDEADAAAILAGLEARMRAFGITDPQVRRGEDGTFAVTVPGGIYPGALIALLTPGGDLRFRIQVLPAARYREWEQGEIPRLQDAHRLPWPEDEAAFDAFKQAEVARWLEARDAGRPYEPSDDRYVVAPFGHADPQAPQDFVVLSEPGDPALRLDGRMLENPQVVKNEIGTPVVAYDIRREHQEAFGSFTEANRGLPLAIVFDGEVITAPIIQTRLEGSVQLDLGGPAVNDNRQAAAKRLAAILEAGLLPAPLEVVRAEDEAGAGGAEQD